MKFKIFLHDKHIYLTLLAIAAIFYLLVAKFPGGYNAIQTGLDPSWRYGLNALNQSTRIFGRDVVFTYGPLGYLLAPMNVGSNLIQTILFRLFIHGLLIGSLLYYLLRRKRTLPVIIFVGGYWLASIIGIGFSEDEYSNSFLIITCLLTGISYLEETKARIPIDIINGLLAISFLFMKFTVGLASLAIITISLFVRLIKKQEGARRSAIATGGAYLLMAAIIGAIYFKSPGNFFNWLGMSLSIADGYSVAMSIFGPVDLLYHALLALGLYFCLLLLLFKGKSRLLHLALALTVPVLFSFKHGFVRQDGHMLVFYPSLIAAVSVIILNVDNKRELILSCISLLLILLLALPVANKWNMLNPSRLKDAVLATEGRLYIYNLLHLSSIRRQLDSQSQVNLEADRLPEEWLSRIRDGNRVGTIPWEASYCAANNLNWDPFPTLQMYTAYTSSLDEWSANHYRGADAPDYLLMDFIPLDGRNLLFDTPATWRAIFQNYRIIQRQSAQGVHLLQKVMQANGEDLTIIGQQQIELDKWITVPASDNLLYAFIDMRLRGIGWIRKAAFRIPSVRVNLIYASGEFRTYRIVPDTARNGLLINYSPGSMEELDRLFEHTAADRVEKFCITGPGAQYYDQTPKLIWKEDQSYKVPVTQEKGIDLAGLQRDPGQTSSAIDTVNSNLFPLPSPITIDSNTEDVITVSGWAIDQQAQKAAAGVFVNIDGRLDVPATYKQERPDIVQAFKSSEYRFCGFRVFLPTDLLGKGAHTLSLKIVSADQTRYYESGQILLVIK